jgi:threonine synthase
MAVLDATAHALKFALFQEKYFADAFEPEFEVLPKRELQNWPSLISPPEGVPTPRQGRPLEPGEMDRFIEYAGQVIAQQLGLRPR